MARPILKVKNIESAGKRYSRVAKKGQKAVRTEFGIPFALQNIIAEKPRAKGAIFATLSNGDRFDGQRLVRLLKRAPQLKADSIVDGVKAAVVG